MSGKRAWFEHSCWFCGLESREVDLIVGDGVYQCHFANRGACQTRHDQLDPVTWARLPKPYCDSRSDWSPHMRARFAEIDLMLGKSH